MSVMADVDAPFARLCSLILDQCVRLLQCERAVLLLRSHAAPRFANFVGVLADDGLEARAAGDYPFCGPVLHQLLEHPLPASLFQEGHVTVAVHAPSAPEYEHSHPRRSQRASMQSRSSVGVVSEVSVEATRELSLEAVEVPMTNATIPGRCVLNQEPEFVDNVRAHPHCDPHLDQLLGEGTRVHTLLCIPLVDLSRNRCIGCLQAINKVPAFSRPTAALLPTGNGRPRLSVAEMPVPFKPEVDLEAATAFAAIATIAIESVTDREREAAAMRSSRASFVSSRDSDRHRC